VIKVLLSDSDDTDWLVKKFRHESEALSRIEHPGVVKVLDRGVLENGKPFFVMEFIKGEILRARIPSGGMDFKTAADYLRQLGQALDAAHDEGVVHRDLKPENIMIQKLSGGGEQIKLIDFGIAKVQKPGTENLSTATFPVGTIVYMAPEQIEKAETSPASDIYTLGIIAHEMLIGARPFRPDSNLPFAAMQQMVSMQVNTQKYVKPLERRADLPVEVADLLLKTLSYSPQDRPAQAREFCDQLAEYLLKAHQSSSPDSKPPVQVDHLATNPHAARATIAAHKGDTAPKPGEAKEPTPPHSDSIATVPPPVKKFPLVPVGIGVVVLAIAGAIGMTMMSPSPAPQPPPGEKPPPTVVKRSFNYWLTVRKNPELFPKDKPFRLPGEVIFSAGDQVWMTFSSPNDGNLYIVNEGPASVQGLPQYVLLFPKPNLNDGNSLVKANQELQLPGEKPWQMDQQEGTEKVWIIWAKNPVSSLEAVKGQVNPTDRGLVTDTAQIKAIQEFLTQSTAKKPEVTKNDETRLSIVTGEGDVATHLLKLEHH
ncbi:MAG TPA: protein kinase, partial [Acidobacteriota bacterium]|nr:protein kinase [Acidobacteriota bacterium]